MNNENLVIFMVGFIAILGAMFFLGLGIGISNEQERAIKANHAHYGATTGTFQYNETCAGDK